MHVLLEIQVGRKFYYIGNMHGIVSMTILCSLHLQETPVHMHAITSTEMNSCLHW